MPWDNKNMKVHGIITIIHGAIITTIIGREEKWR